MGLHKNFDTTSYFLDNGSTNGSTTHLTRFNKKVKMVKILYFAYPCNLSTRIIFGRHKNFDTTSYFPDYGSINGFATHLTRFNKRVQNCLNLTYLATY